MLEIDVLFNFFIEDCMFIPSIFSRMIKFYSNWAYSWAWGSLTIGVSWLSTSFPYIGSSFKFKPEWISLPHAKSTNSAMLYSASIITSYANCTYSSMGIPSLPRFKEEMRLANSFVVFSILNFLCSSSMAKLTL